MSEKTDAAAKVTVHDDSPLLPEGKYNAYLKTVKFSERFGGKCDFLFSIPVGDPVKGIYIIPRHYNAIKITKGVFTVGKKSALMRDVVGALDKLKIGHELSSSIDNQTMLALAKKHFDRVHFVVTLRTVRLDLEKKTIPKSLRYSTVEDWRVGSA